MFVGADKTANFYKMEAKEYNKLVEKNVTSDYKKTTQDKVDKITEEDRQLVTKLDIEDRVFKTTEREAFATIKHHKDNFANNPKIRLLNPTKPEIGKISKKITERIVKEVKDVTKVTQWKNTDSVLKWFAYLHQKHTLTFLQFDVVNFYPSITKKLLQK